MKYQLLINCITLAGLATATNIPKDGKSLQDPLLKSVLEPRTMQTLFSRGSKGPAPSKRGGGRPAPAPAGQASAAKKARTIPSQDLVRRPPTSVMSAKAPIRDGIRNPAAQALINKGSISISNPRKGGYRDRTASVLQATGSARGARAADRINAVGGKVRDAIGGMKLNPDPVARFQQNRIRAHFAQKYGKQTSSAATGGWNPQQQPSNLQRMESIGSSGSSGSDGSDQGSE